MRTVVLTPEAVKRLDVARHLATVVRKRAARTRRLGAEVMSLSGSTLVVAAPFAGVLRATSEHPQGPMVGQRVNAGAALFSA